MEIHAPPALLACSYGIIEYLKELEPKAMDGAKIGYGLSFGEICSMPFLGTINYDDCAKLMKKR